MIARPGRLQEQTGFRALSAIVPFEKRFDPEGPYQKSFQESVSYSGYMQGLKDERKRQKQENDILRSVLFNLPRIANWMSNTGRNQYIAKPLMEER